MNASKPYILVVVIALLVGAVYFIDSNSVKKGGSDESIAIVPRTSSEQDEMKKEDKMKRYELAKEITTPDGFINTPSTHSTKPQGGEPVESTSSRQVTPITIGEFVGKRVVLIDFWTYSCINCQRTTPYLNAWYEKYKDKGLVIIGIHTPEFEFEKDYNNVKAAVDKFGIKFPVVLDNDYSTWTAYKNQYWPRKYLIDIDGYVVYDHIGEGAYEETEKKIQETLSERMAVLGESGFDVLTTSGAISQPLTKDISVENGAKSPETYFGSARNDQQKNLLFPNDSWDITPEFAQNNSVNASIVYTYTAKDVFFVAESDTETVVEVLRDGKPLGPEAGADIIKTPDGKTIVRIQEARLYKIIQGDKSETHKLEMRIQKPGLKVFTFTFG